jgi:hypothetical protein
MYLDMLEYLVFCGLRQSYMLPSYSKMLHPHNLKKSSEALFGASKEIVLEMIAEKFKFMFCE